MTDFKHGVWHPIKSIPKDSSIIFACFKDLPFTKVRMVFFRDGEWHYFPYGSMNKNGSIQNPVRWMPLPNSPEDL